MPLQLGRPRARVPVIRNPGCVFVQGMGGMGDNLHQRALVRQLMASWTVYLETPWPSIYHDLMGSRLRLIRHQTSLRTQAKNVRREWDKYDVLPPGTMRTLPVWYTPNDVRSEGSVLAAMLKSVHCSERDFSMPVPADWHYQLDAQLPYWVPTKPVMVYRPLIERTEWGGCFARNPDPDAYYTLVQSIRDQFYVVSVADLVPGVEWMTSQPIRADIEFHHGELSFEMLAALMERASLSYASPGFATILAQAVGTPSVCIFGGYENSSSFSAGAALAPYLGIDPINPCSCFSHKHPCRKDIDVPRAASTLDAFIAATKKGLPAQPDPAGVGAAGPHRLDVAIETLHEPGGVGGPGDPRPVSGPAMRD
jgi:hypothetical protein